MWGKAMTPRLRRQNGAALLEAAITLPILLLIAVGIFEFGRAYQTWQVLTNAAREGARMAVLPNTTSGIVEARVRDCMQLGQLPGYDDAVVQVNRNATLTMSGSTVSASSVAVNYPFQFVVLQPVARLVDPRSSIPGALTIQASAVMRNETQ
jgi:Flp pilus assembly protein TadG